MTDREIIRDLARQKVEIAGSERNKKSIEKWYNVNDLRMSVPPVIIYQLPWHEIKDQFLTIKTQNPELHRLERTLRQEIYVHKTFKTDNVVSGIVECPMAFSDSDIGIRENVDVVKTDEDSNVYSRHFHVEIAGEEDLYKIKEPEIAVDKKENERRMSFYTDILSGICDVTLVGRKGYWFAPWDNLVRLTGVEELYYALVDRPEFIHTLMRRYMDCYKIKMKKYCELGIWSSNNDNTFVGSGGYGYCSHLDKPPAQNNNVDVKQIWGCGNAQIFTEVSPQMHYEFSLQYELEWMSHFGLNYYGCCEQLHNKIDMLKKIPNLRKISISPWADVDIASERIGKDYVMSIKPNPAVFAANFDTDYVHNYARKLSEKIKYNNAEIVMKDVSTICGNVNNVAKWCEIMWEVFN